MAKSDISEAVAMYHRALLELGGVNTGQVALELPPAPEPPAQKPGARAERYRRGWGTKRRAPTQHS